MPAVSIVQFISAAFSLIQGSWKLYQAYQKQAASALIAKLDSELDDAYSRLKKSTNSQEKKDAATQLAQSHRDILK